MASITKRARKKGASYLVRIRRKDADDLTRTFRSKTKAENWARQQESAIDHGDSTSSESVKKTLNDLVPIYKAEGFQEKPDSKKKQISQMKFWRKKIGNKRLCDITPATICRYRRELRNRATNRGDRTANSTVNRYVSALSGAMEFAVTNLGWLKANPVKQVTRLPENPAPIRFLDKETELLNMTMACSESPNKRMLPLFMTAIGTGLRAMALLWLHVSEIDLKKCTIRIPVERSKNGRAFTLGISDTLFPYMVFLVENSHPESGLLFPSPSNPYKRMCYRDDWEEALKVAGIKNFRFHDCRHTCGSYMAMTGCSLTDIAEQLNHKTLEMAKRYSHVAEEYRAIIPTKMHDTFLAEVSSTVLHALDFKANREDKQ